MRVIGQKILAKLKNKNSGNKQLRESIDQLILDLKQFDPHTLIAVRKDADCVHRDGFYFFNIHVHRTLILIELDDEADATIVWAGTHDEYERTFKNNKSTIEKWLRRKGYIQA